MDKRTGMIHPRFDSKRHSIFTVARHQYAWPGGYLMFAVMKDGESMCPDCVEENAALIARSTRENGRTGWEFAGVSSLAECDDAGQCCNCNRDLATL